VLALKVPPFLTHDQDKGEVPAGSRPVTVPHYRPLLSQEGNFSDKSHKCSHSLLCVVQ